MATVIKYATHVENAMRFMDIYGLAANTSDYLYLATGRPGILTGQNPPQQWTDPALPDTPEDTADDESEFWLSVIGMKQVSASRTIPVVPRNDWTTGITYVPFDTASTTAYNDLFYVVNSEYRVYKCTTGDVSANEPLESAEVSGIVTGADGIVWEYLYELPQVVIDNLLSDTWMPVNYADTIDAGDTTATRDDLAVFTLGAKYILVQVKLEDTDTDVGVIGSVYRQTAIISNPLDADGTLKLTALTSSEGDTGSAGFTNATGNFLHLENKGVITRATGQTEVVQTILQF